MLELAKRRCFTLHVIFLQSMPICLHHDGLGPASHRAPEEKPTSATGRDVKKAKKSTFILSRRTANSLNGQVCEASVDSDA